MFSSSNQKNKKNARPNDKFYGGGIPPKLRKIQAERAKEMKKLDEEREYYESISID